MDGGAALIRPHRFTVTEYDKMAEVGIFGEGCRVELIRGQIVDLVPIGAAHNGAVIRFTHLLVMAVSGRGFVSVQNPVRLADDSEPQPDFAILRPRADYYANAVQTAEDVLVIIEVADSSLEWDSRVKTALYAENQLPDYWILNLADRVVDVYRKPQAGKYTDISSVGLGAFSTS